VLDEPELVYNFMVKGPHTYFVLEVGVLVHNCGPGADQARLKTRFQELHKNLLTLQEREAKYGGNAPLELLNQIDDHKRAVESALSALAGEITIEEFIGQTESLLIDSRLFKPLARSVQISNDPRLALKQIHDNYLILLEKEAKYGGNVPLELLHQISDHEYGIELAKEAIEGRISIQEFVDQIRYLQPNPHSNKWLNEMLQESDGVKQAIMQLARNTQISDHEYGIELAKEAIEGRISIQEFVDQTNDLILDVHSASILKAHGSSTNDFKAAYLQLHNDLNILKEREAKYGPYPPLELINQIDNYDYAIGLTKLFLDGKVTPQRYVEEVNSLILDY
jgi:hypothetical protein